MNKTYKKDTKVGKKGGKKAEPQETDRMTEVEKDLYKIQINDLLQKVERLETRCSELEMSNEEHQRRYEQLDEDRADIIANLKKMLQEKEDENTEMQERLEGLKETLQQERLINMKTKNMEHEFRVMREELTSEINLLTGKLKSLEDFRLDRDDLMKKLEAQEQDMADQELRHKQTLYEVERKFVIEKYKLTKEIDARLLQLSKDFQATTDVRIAATTHRAMRENIAVNKELQKMLETQRKQRKENEIIKERDRKLNLEVQLCKEERDIVLAKNMALHKVIKRLTTEYEGMVRNIGELKNSAHHAIELEQQMQEMRQLFDTQVKQIAMLKEKLHTTEHEKNETIYNLPESNIETYKLQDILRAAIKSIKETLEVQTQPSSDEALSLSRRENLLSNLLRLLNTVDLSGYEKQKEKLVSVMESSEAYMGGNFGFAPKSSSELCAESHYPVGSSGLMKSVKASVEGFHHSGKLKVKSVKSDQKEVLRDVPNLKNQKQVIKGERLQNLGSPLQRKAPRKTLKKETLESQDGGETSEPQDGDEDGHRQE